MFLFQKETKIINLIIIIFISFFFTQHSFSYNLKKTPFIKKNIEIELTNKNLKKFYKFLREINFNKVKSRDEKKWIKAKIIYNGQQYNGKIRINGSPTTMDHIDFKRGITSFHVKIIDQEINGIKNFRLLLPRTKNFENEIFWSLLMENLGYPTPYTSLVSLKFNNLNTQMIFQEKTEKEFLERWNLGNLPIIEGNTSYWMKKRVQCMKTHKDDFENCFNKNIINFVESYKIENNNFIKKNNYNLAFNAILSENYYFQKNFEELNAPYGSHGLSFKNSKFFYDPYYNHKVSIYFDGDITFKKFDMNKCNDNLANIPKEFRDNFRKRASKKLNKKFECVASYYLSRKDLYFKKPEFVDININYEFKLHDFKKNKNVQYLIFNKNLDSFQLCKPELYCENTSFSNAKKILSGSHSIYNNNDIQKLVLPAIENKINKIVDKIVIKSENSFIETKNNSLTYINFDDEFKNIDLNIKLKNNSKIYISNSKLVNLNLNIDMEKLTKQNNAEDYVCVTFLDSFIENLKLISNKNKCKDNIKNVRSKISILN